jgi:hypothetical protein
VDFSKARDLFLIIFQIPGAFMKICGLRVDIQEVQGPFYKVVEIKEFPNLIYIGKFCGPSPRWTMGGADTGRGSAMPVHDTWALGLTGARWRGATGRGGGGTRGTRWAAHRGADGSEVAG